MVGFRHWFLNKYRQNLPACPSCSIWAAMTQSFWSSGLLRGRCNRRLARDPRAGFRAG